MLWARALVLSASSALLLLFIASPSLAFGTPNKSQNCENSAAKSPTMKEFLVAFQKSADRARSLPENSAASAEIGQLIDHLKKLQKSFNDFEDIYLPKYESAVVAAPLVSKEVVLIKQKVGMDNPTLLELTAFDKEFEERHKKTLRPNIVLRALRDWASLYEAGTPVLNAAGACQSISAIESFVRARFASRRLLSRPDRARLEQLFEYAQQAVLHVTPALAADRLSAKDLIEAREIADIELKRMGVPEALAATMRDAQIASAQDIIRVHRNEVQRFFGADLSAPAMTTRLKQLTLEMLKEFRNDTHP